MWFIWQCELSVCGIKRFCARVCGRERWSGKWIWREEAREVCGGQVVRGPEAPQLLCTAEATRRLQEGK